MMGITHAAAGALAGAAVAHLTGGNLALCMAWRTGRTCCRISTARAARLAAGSGRCPRLPMQLPGTGATHTVWFCLAASLGLGALYSGAGRLCRALFSFSCLACGLACRHVGALGCFDPPGARRLYAIRDQAVARLTWPLKRPGGARRADGVAVDAYLPLACLKAARIF